MAAGEKNCLPDPGLVWGPWKCLPEKLLIHVPTGMAVVADLHLGYRGGDGDTLDDSLNKVMAPLLRAWRREKPRGLVIAGDLVDQPGKKLFAAIHQGCPGGNSPGETGIGREGPRNRPGRASYSDAVSSGSCPGSHQKRKRQ